MQVKPVSSKQRMSALWSSRSVRHTNRTHRYPTSSRRITQHCHALSDCAHVYLQQERHRRRQRRQRRLAWYLRLTRYQSWTATEGASNVNWLRWDRCGRERLGGHIDKMLRRNCRRLWVEGGGGGVGQGRGSDWWCWRRVCIRQHTSAYVSIRQCWRLVSRWGCRGGGEEGEMTGGGGGDEGKGRVCVWLESKGAERRCGCSPRVRGTPTRIVAYTHNKTLILQRLTYIYTITVKALLRLH
jgi:hypothetical protein